MSVFWKHCLLAIAVLTMGCGQASADKRVALVIGNGAYAHKAELANPPHDAQDVAAALKRTDFEVILATNLGQAEMQDAIIRFARAARNADVAMFYYSGHAMQFNGVNYLMPTDAKLDDEADLKRFARVDDIMNDLQQARNLRILVLDSCRDNPFAESLKRSARGLSIRQGLSKIDAPIGTIVSFSTQAGQTADDGNGRNSPYTAAFVKRIGEPKEIGEIFRDISSDVYQSSGRVQLPELSLSIIGKFYLNAPASAASPVPATAPPDGVASAPRANSGKFDGAWDLKISCPQSGKAAGWDRYMSAVVKDNVMHGEHLKPSNPAWLVIDGRIGVDGKATLMAKGLTGNPAMTVNNAKAGSPYGFTISAQFDNSSGTGKRNELRPCDLTFAKR
jgi:hypothetical protein